MLTTVGIHPLAAVGVVAVDSMLFGGTVATGGVGWTASVPVGIALGVAVGFIQYRGHDALGLAVGKDLMGRRAHGDSDAVAVRTGCRSRDSWRIHLVARQETTQASRQRALEGQPGSRS